MADDNVGLVKDFSSCEFTTSARSRKNDTEVDVNENRG
jgi:hypothetical protein